MGWLSLCVCGTKRNSDDRKIKKDEKRKRNKKSKKNSKQKGSPKGKPPFIVDELCKSQDEQPKEKEWANGEIVNYLNDCATNRIDSTDQTENSLKINGSPSCQISDDHEDFEKSLKKSERNVSESAREPCDIDYYNVILHSRCTSSIVDENEKQDKCIWDEEEYNEEVDLDESISRSGEPEDSSWTSEIEDRQDTVLESSFDRKFGERISSRINFSKEDQGKPKTQASLKKKGTRNILPLIKGTSRAEACMDNEELQAHGETNKFKKTATSREKIEVRRKLNSCSFDIHPFEDKERSERTTKIRGEKSMIPRLASPLQGMNLVKNDSDKSEIVQNGRVHSAVVSGINLEQRTVTVEWFERGETKGKEVEIDAILALNRDLNQKMGPRGEICALPQVMNNHMLASSRAREPDSSGEEDEGVDESENQEEGSLGRHGGHTTRNGLASATLPVRVTSRLSVTRTIFPSITATTATATYDPLIAVTVSPDRQTDLSISDLTISHREFHYLNRSIRGNCMEDT